MTLLKSYISKGNRLPQNNKIFLLAKASIVFDGNRAIIKKNVMKNPTYGRHEISKCMWTGAPIPENLKKKRKI